MRKEQREYTYEDYLTWSEEEGYEIIDGVVYSDPITLSVHQMVLENLCL